MNHHGRFCTVTGRPLVVIGVKHPKLQFELSIEFLVDSGADNTFISPDDEIRFSSVPKACFCDVPGAVHTIGGTAQFIALPKCSLNFRDPMTGVDNYVPNISLWMLKPNNKKHLSGEGAFPSVLGRDVLHEFAIGYSKSTEDYLFLTAKPEAYYELLREHFPKPDIDGTPWIRNGR